MKMWSIRFILLLLFCYACLSTGSGKVYFVSRNFDNILHWNAAEPAFPDENLTYSVQYRNDADKPNFGPKEGCQNIVALSCDLTSVTPSVHDVHYWAKVLVNDRFHGITDTRFTPIKHTTLGPPILSTLATVSSLHLNVTLPLRSDGVSVADIIAKSKNGPFISGIVYILKITHPEWAVLVNKSETGRFIINLKNNHTEYHGYVVYKPRVEWGRSESEKTSFRVTLPGLLAAVVIVSAVCVCNYTRGGKPKSMPQQLILTSNTQPRILYSLDKNLILSKPEIYTQSDQTVYATIQVKPNVSLDGVGGYSPQDIPCQAWQGSDGSSVVTGAHSSSPNPKDVSAQSSEIYSVVAVQVPAEERDFQQATINGREAADQPLLSSKESWDKVGLTSHGASQLPPLDPFDSNLSRTLLLHTVRDNNGQLVLPSLTFQLQSNTGDTERKLLLSDLIESKREGPSLTSLQSSDSSEWSDSGCDDSTLNSPVKSYCNAHCLPSQPVGSYLSQGCQNVPSGDECETGYKQNWMPAIVPGPASRDGCEYKWTNCSWAWSGFKNKDESEEEEDRGGEEHSGKTLLGGWVVEIQE
ncbi:interferon lambda receptor 1 isoform X2 [Antennarius striatus]|uniref:interferon lambda receptor 1 isoform X2 n=1 Tax=Antennarius striatus TaxID=241820 RepID=UPI0035ADB4CF